MRPAEPGRMISGMDSPKGHSQAKNSVFDGRIPLQKRCYFKCLWIYPAKDREYLTKLLRNSISLTIRRAWWLGALSTPGGGSKSKEKRLLTKGNCHAAEHQGTLCGDGDGRPGRKRHGGPDTGGISPRGPGRYCRPPGYFTLLSGTAVCQAAARRAVAQRALARRRLSPVTAQRRVAHCRHHSGGG